MNKCYWVYLQTYGGHAHSPPSTLALPQVPSGTWIRAVPSQMVSLLCPHSPQASLSPQSRDPFTLGFSSGGSEGALTLLRNTGRRNDLIALSMSHDSTTEIGKSFIFICLFSQNNKNLTNITSAPSPNCKPCPFLASKIDLQTCRQSRNGKRIIPQVPFPCFII